MRIALIVLALVLGLIVALVAALPWLAEPALRAGLRLAGQDRIDFQRLQVGWDGLEAEGIALGQADQELARLQVDYRWPDLLEGRLERVEIEGLVVRAALRDGELQLDGFETTDQATDGPAVPLPEVGEVVLQDARIELRTELGTLHLPFAVRVLQTGQRLTFDAMSDEARLDGPLGTVRARLALEGELPRDVPITLDAVRASADMTLVADNATLGIAHQVDGEARLGFDLAEGRLRLDLALEDAGLTMADLALRGISLHQRAALSYAGDGLTVEAEGAGAVAIESLEGPDLRAGPLRLRFEPRERPLLELAIDQGRPAAWRQDAAAVIETAALHLAAPALDLESRAGVVALASEGVGAMLTAATIGLTDGELTLPQHALSLEGIATEARLTANGPVPDRRIPITVARLHHGGRPAWFAPLALQGALVPGEGSVAFEADLSRIGGGVTLGVRGEHRAAGSGRATVDLAPVILGPRLQPKDLSPLAAGLVSDVAGQIAVDGDLTWSPGGLSSQLAVLVDQLALTSGPARLEQVNGVIQLDRLWPPATPPGQQLAIGLLDLGLPLTEGLTTFQLVAGPRIDVSQLEWRLAGGLARAEPFSLGSPLEGTNVTLRAQQLDLGPLLELTRLDGLSGEGSLDGVLPVRLSGGAAIIEGGELAATGPGVLRYASGAAPTALQAGGEGVDLLLQALENFHYEALRITLDGRTDAAMDIGLHLGGANPELYDGHPIEFNLDLEGELGNILRQGVASYQIPDRVRERMLRFGR